MIATETITERVRELPWAELHADLDERGFARTAGILDSEECEDLAALWEEGSFRSRVEMARHGFGVGEYKYFANPLPAAVNELRRGLLSAAGRGREPLGRHAGHGPGVAG